MYTWESETTTIIYNSDLSGETIIKTPKGELEVDMNEIARFLLASVFAEDAETRFLEKIIQDDSNDVTGFSIETSETVRDSIQTVVRTVRGGCDG